MASNQVVIADMGGELFVMDDGWFGEKYPRNSDKTSLGDWTVDRKKLPEGIGGLLASAKAKGIKFGIWIEPEMTNMCSELNVIDNKPLSFEGKSFSGQYLMEHGLEMPLNHSVARSERIDWSSRVLLLEAE